MFGSWRIGSLAGIPVKVHFSLVILLPWFVARYGRSWGLDATGGLLVALGVFVSVALHELGHALAARRLRVGTREILLTPIGGVAKLDRIPTRPRDELIIALAGPAASLALAVVGYAVFLGFAETGWAAAGWVFGALTAANVALAVFNLLPCFPMDGGRVFRALAAMRVGRLAATRRAVSLAGWMALVLAAWGLSRGSLLTVALAWFVHSAARAELRAVEWEEQGGPVNPLELLLRMGQMGTPGGAVPREPRPPDEVVVGPPPYRR